MAQQVQQAKGGAGRSVRMEQLSAANTEFALSLYRQLCGDGGNVFFSPYSISVALAMTSLGARGSTEAAMKGTLCYKDMSNDVLHSTFSTLHQQLYASDKYTLQTANRLYGEQTYSFLQDFLNATKKNYGAELASVDFKGAAEQVRGTINKWVEEQTKDKIKDLIPAGAVDAMTRLVLVNAIYFKGNWDKQFKAEMTQDMDFNINNNEKVKVPMMKMEEKFNYGEFQDQKFRVLELPYVEKELSMLIFLPDEVEGIRNLESALTATTLQTVSSQMYSTKVNLMLPRFKLEQDFSLGETLKKMGMGEAFSDGADFSGMSAAADLFISEVVHKAFVEVNEEGTEAAAATGVRMKMRMMPRPPVPFLVDHPFMFLIRDNRSSSVLFLGRMSKPTEG
ncbi:PREDICTED: leukocyte elastase inhibitor-like isoform X1 [Branchiostoma belcheri]|uniref:Leukocyte elastase inhibitor-like isoform X1 n=2 Tax=Branchiostoma belcheri TaxID=7741 RepID=A0A6P5ABM9_BRABE|nr:PREDICTED: leukocyte elastase inhibitor-like isoform X1 [Branchiostoma belcheri]